jgi:hypothetical protein
MLALLHSERSTSFLAFPNDVAFPGRSVRACCGGSVCLATSLATQGEFAVGAFNAFVARDARLTRSGGLLRGQLILRHRCNSKQHCTGYGEEKESCVHLCAPVELNGRQ